MRELDFDWREDNFLAFLEDVLRRQVQRGFYCMCALSPFGVGEVVLLDLALFCDEVAAAHRAGAPALEPALHFRNVEWLSVRPDRPGQLGAVALCAFVLP